MATNFRGKVGKISLFTFIDHFRIPKRMEYLNADRRIHSGHDLAASYENLVNFGPVTLEFAGIICVHPASIIFLKILLDKLS